eukprot:gene12-19_t
MAGQQTLREALKEACSHSGFGLLAFGFFVCGFQVVFIGVHLPAYLVERHFAEPMLDLDGLQEVVARLIAEAARVLEQEHVIYPKGLALLAAGRLQVENERTVVEGERTPRDVLVVPRV